MSNPPDGKPHRRLRPTKARELFAGFLPIVRLKKCVALAVRLIVRWSCLRLPGVIANYARAHFCVRASAFVLAISEPRYRRPASCLSRGSAYARHYRRRAEYSILKALSVSVLTLIVNFV